MAEPLGDLTRTHTCGALRADDVGADVGAARLGAPRPRSWRRDLHRHPRPRRRVAGRRARQRRAAWPIAKRLRSEFVIGVSGVVQRRSDDTVNPEARDRRGRGAGARDSAAERGEDAAVPDCRGLRRCPRTCGCATATSICGGRGCSTTSACVTAWRWRSRQYFDANGFWEIETPILAKSTPEGARDFLVPSRVHAGRVLRAAAVAADLQADPDDRRHRSVLPDRALLPRRGSARRPAARVHADRRRDVVRAPETGLRPHRAADAGRSSRRSAGR